MILTRISREIGHRSTVAVLLAATMLVAACGSGESDSSTPVVVTTNSVWADVVEQVACEGDVAVESLIPAGADPHGFELSLADRGRLDAAALVVATGEGEDLLADSIEASEDDGAAVIRMDEHLDLLDEHSGDDAEHADEDAEHADEDAEGHDHGADDPHVWLDPVRVAEALPALGAALVSEAGLDPDAVDRCRIAFTDALTDLSDQVTTILAPLDGDQRSMVTDHPSLAYFADRYDLEVVGTISESGSSVGAAGPAHLQVMVETIIALEIGALFVEAGAADDDVQAVAARADGVEVVAVRVDSLGPPGSGSDTYLGLLTTLAEDIVAGLG